MGAAVRPQPDAGRRPARPSGSRARSTFCVDCVGRLLPCGGGYIVFFLALRSRPLLGPAATTGPVPAGTRPTGPSGTASRSNGLPGPAPKPRAGMLSGHDKSATVGRGESRLRPPTDHNSAGAIHAFATISAADWHRMAASFGEQPARSPPEPARASQTRLKGARYLKPAEGIVIGDREPVSLRGCIRRGAGPSQTTKTVSERELQADQLPAAD